MLEEADHPCPRYGDRQSNRMVTKDPVGQGARAWPSLFGSLPSDHVEVDPPEAEADYQGDQAR